jgi:hypothetical protein
VFSARDIKSERLVVPEWDNVEFEIRGMNGTERGRFLAANSDNDGKVADPAKTQVTLIIATTFDPTTGQRVFEEADRDMLLTKSAEALDKVGRVAARLSGLAVDAAKNDSGASGSSTSGSPAISG